jgi:hypothetical protein
MSAVVDGAAVVGIDQAEIPPLGALVDVGHAGRGELEHELGEPVGGAAGAMQVDERAHLGRNCAELAGSRAAATKSLTAAS